MNIKHKSTLENFEKILKVRNYSNRSIEIYSHYVYKFIESFNKSGLHITSKEIKEYLIYHNYSSVSQQNQIYSALKLYCKYILNIKFIDKIFLERPRKDKKLPKIIDKELLVSKLSQISNLKHKAILSLSFSTGLRVSEVINLKIEDIDSKRMIINIRQAKGNKDRIVPLSQNILNLLRIYYKEYKPEIYLFNGQNSLQYSSNSCNKLVKKYLGEEYHMHLLRHSCFTSLLESGTDLRIIQKIAGHNNVKTTEIYTHVSTNLLNKVNLPI